MTIPNPRTNSVRTDTHKIVSLLRSPLLTAMPTYVAEGRRARIIWRLTRAGMILGSILLLIAMTRGRWLGQSGPGKVLYWLHDNVYLWLRGYFYTLFYPTSIVWHAVIVLLFLSWLLFFVCDRSLVRWPHIHALKALLWFPVLHPFILASARWFRHHNYPPDMLMAVVAHKRECSLLDLADRKTWNSQLPLISPAHQVATLTRMLIDLRLLRDEHQDLLLAACDFQEALLLLRFRGDHRTARKLAGTIWKFIYHTNPPSKDRPLEEAIKLAPNLDLRSCLADLILLAQIAGAGAIAPINSDARLAFSPSEAHVQRYLQRLAVACEWRREQIDRLRITLEQGLRTRRSAQSNPVASRPEIPFAPSVRTDDLSLLGALALRISLGTALEGRSADLALGFLDAVEALRLAAASITPNDPNASVAQRASAWISAVPEPLDYQMAASLADESQQALWGMWRPYLMSGDSAISQKDATLAASRVASLYQAAGIDRENCLLPEERGT